jgi:hypothetical protein
MAKIGTGMTALLLGLLTCAPLQAAEHRSRHDHSGRHFRDGRRHVRHALRRAGIRHYKKRNAAFYRGYLRRHGHRLRDGAWIYRGRGHRHWAWSYFSPFYRTTFYWDPAVETYYYWCAPRGAFYPQSYLEVAPPTDDLGPLGDDEDED